MAEKALTSGCYRPFGAGTAFPLLRSSKSAPKPGVKAPMKTIQFSMMILLVILLSVFGYFYASEMPYPKSMLEDVEGTQYKGYYAYGFETNNFMPCNSEEVWWVESDLPAIVEETLSGTEMIPNSLYYVELGGEITGPGNYGHLGASDRNLKVRVVKVATLVSSVICPANEFWISAFLNKRL